VKIKVHLKLLLFHRIPTPFPPLIQQHGNRYLVLYCFLWLGFGGEITVTKKKNNRLLEGPEEWKYRKDVGGAMLGHDSIAGAILVYPHQFNSLDELKLQMRQGTQEEMNYLQLKSDPVPFGKNGFIADYTGVWDYQKAKAKGIGTFSPSGSGGAVVIAMSTPQMFSKKLVDAAVKIAKSIRYSHDDNTNLTQHFVGKWSTWSKNSESHIYLYPDGTYLNTESSSYGNSDPSLGATWGMAGDNSRHGHWKVRGTLSKGKLITIDSNGESYVYDYNIHTEHGQAYRNEYFINGILYNKSALQ